VTSQVRTPTAVGEVIVNEWKKAGLLKPSVIKPVMTTVEKQLVLRKLGHLEPQDSNALRDALKVILG
jgi:mRNA interferase MazF